MPPRRWCCCSGWCRALRWAARSGPTTAFMAEAAPPHRRGLYLSMQYATQDGASLIAGFVGVRWRNSLSDTQLQEWGWRAAMLLGRLHRALRSDAAAIAARDAARGRRRRAGARCHDAASLTMRGGVRPYLAIIVLRPDDADGRHHRRLHHRLHDDLCARHAETVGDASPSVSPSSMAASRWSSRRLAAGFPTGIGRKPVMIIPGVLLVLSIFPGFWAIDHFRNVWALYGAEAVIVILAALSAMPVIITITEQLPASIRSGAVATDLRAWRSRSSAARRNS